MNVLLKIVKSIEKVDLSVLYYCFIVVGSLQGYHQPLLSTIFPIVWEIPS